ncbi:MAG TPA: DUF1289 domain-containing protein [Burkholderiales bacterium]|nr:DUF1289 domain-containing protein [Burkholderiales bacterium]
MTKAVESPCNKVCQMDPNSGLCIGCARTLDEIARWAEMSDAERERVMAQLPHRNSGTEPELRRVPSRN